MKMCGDVVGDVAVGVLDEGRDDDGGETRVY